MSLQILLEQQKLTGNGLFTFNYKLLKSVNYNSLYLFCLCVLNELFLAYKGFGNIYHCGVAISVEYPECGQICLKYK